MALPQVLFTFRAFLSAGAGYPDGAPASGYVPLSWRCCLVGRQLMKCRLQRGTCGTRSVPGRRHEYRSRHQTTQRASLPQDAERVTQRLQALDSPVDDQFSSSG
jgi:hypothetical protein